MVRGSALGSVSDMQAAGLVLTSYQDSLARVMDIVANNVANINTTGFKRQEVAFETYMMHPTPQDKWSFSVENGTYRDTSSGPSVDTGNPLDVALQGQGYFAVETPEGVRYTRAGAFMMNADGEIVTPAGYKLLGDGDQAITLPADASDITISADGVVTAKSGTASVQAGKLRAVKFANEQELQIVGNGLYQTSQPAETDTEAHFVQGAIEQSNVQSVTEITRMIDVSRSYQQVLHLLDLENQRETNAINRLGKATA